MSATVRLILLYYFRAWLGTTLRFYLTHTHTHTYIYIYGLFTENWQYLAYFAVDAVKPISLPLIYCYILLYTVTYVCE